MSARSFDTHEVLEHGLACFYLGDAAFGLSIRLVREINPHLEITPAHKAPSYVRGLINLRGQIVTVIDLGERLGLGLRTIGPESRLVILKTNSELAALERCELESCEDKIGFLIDRIADVATPRETMGILDAKALLTRESATRESDAGALVLQ
jgi:chemotaxis signal transduction protein